MRPQALRQSGLDSNPGCISYCEATLTRLFFPFRCHENARCEELLLLCKPSQDAECRQDSPPSVGDTGLGAWGVGAVPLVGKIMFCHPYSCLVKNH